MARSREFEERAVLDAAVQCFWSRGYEATTARPRDDWDHGRKSPQWVRRQARALSSRAGSLRRQRFGDRVGRLRKVSAREAIGAFSRDHRAIVERHGAKRLHVGELALEMAPRSGITAGRCRGPGSGGRFFRRCAAAGQKNGTISTSQATEDLARLLLSTLLGIQVLARTRPERKLLEGLIRPVFALLDSPLHSSRS